MADKLMTCPKCGERKYIGSYGEVCFACFLKSGGGEGTKPPSNDIMLTTETHLDLPISRRIEIVTAECAYGMNVFKDLFAGIRNIVGGRSEAVQKTMSRHVCTSGIKN